MLGTLCRDCNNEHSKEHTHICNECFLLNYNNTDVSESVHPRSNHSFIDVNAIRSKNTTDFEYFQSQQEHSSHSDVSQQLTKLSKAEIEFNRKGIHIANLNIRHMKPQLNEMKILLNSTKHIDSFGLCETFLSELFDSDILNIDGYTFERNDRHENNTASANKGGGVLFTSITI